MITLIVDDESKQAKAFLELVKTFDFVGFIPKGNEQKTISLKKEVERKPKSLMQNKLVNDFEKAKIEINNHLSGKKKLKTLDAFLDEI